MTTNTTTVASTLIAATEVVAKAEASAPKAFLLIAGINARVAEEKTAEAHTRLSAVTQVWGDMTITEIRASVARTLPKATPEEAALLKGMAEEAIREIEAADAANKEAKRARRLADPQNLREAATRQVTEEQLEKAAKETAKLAVARKAQEEAQEARIVKITDDLSQHLKLTDGDRRAVRRFLIETRWDYIPNQDGRQALLRATRAAAAAQAKTLKGKK